MAISFFGVSSNPADNGDLAASTVAVTPPASMQTGDLVVVFLHQRGTAVITQNETGGQSWTALANAYTATNTSNTVRMRAFWCQFNGTWSADPSWNFSATNATTAVMIVFRPTSTSHTWSVDTALANASTTSSPYTIAGRTPVNDNNVTIAHWASNDDNTWGNLSGTNWTKSGLAAQYRNVAGSDQSSTFAYQIQGTKAATNDVSQEQLTLGPDNIGTAIVTFYETGSGYVSPIKNRIVN